MSPSGVLLVDDNEMVAQAIGDLLSVSGYDVIWARSADEGWERFQRDGARVVITDNAMTPRLDHIVDDMSGMDLAVRIKRLSPVTPVIMLSAMPPEGAAAVCDAVLGKPVTMRVLLSALLGVGAGPNRPPGRSPRGRAAGEGAAPSK